MLILRYLRPRIRGNHIASTGALAHAILNVLGLKFGRHIVNKLPKCNKGFRIWAYALEDENKNKVGRMSFIAQKGGMGKAELRVFMKCKPFLFPVKIKKVGGWFGLDVGKLQKRKKC